MRPRCGSPRSRHSRRPAASRSRARRAWEPRPAAPPDRRPDGHRHRRPSRSGRRPSPAARAPVRRSTGSGCRWGRSQDCAPDHARRRPPCPVNRRSARTRPAAFSLSRSRRSGRSALDPLHRQRKTPPVSPGKNSLEARARIRCGVAPRTSFPQRSVSRLFRTGAGRRLAAVREHRHRDRAALLHGRAAGRDRRGGRVAPATSVPLLVAALGERRGDRLLGQARAGSPPRGWDYLPSTPAQTSPRTPPGRASLFHTGRMPNTTTSQTDDPCNVPPAPRPTDSPVLLGRSTGEGPSTAHVDDHLLVVPLPGKPQRPPARLSSSAPPSLSPFRMPRGPRARARKPTTPAAPPLPILVNRAKDGGGGTCARRPWTLIHPVISFTESRDQVRPRTLGETDDPVLEPGRKPGTIRSSQIRSTSRTQEDLVKDLVGLRTCGLRDCGSRVPGATRQRCSTTLAHRGTRVPRRSNCFYARRGR